MCPNDIQFEIWLLFVLQIYPSIFANFLWIELIQFQTDDEDFEINGRNNDQKSNAHIRIWKRKRRGKSEISSAWESGVSVRDSIQYR